MQNLLDEKNEELDRLQKENERYKRIKPVSIDGEYEIDLEEFLNVSDKLYELERNSVSKDKIREKIEEITDKYNRIYKFPSPKVEETPEGQLIYKIRFNTDSEALRIVKVILEELLKEE
jgi:hypothetical protein